MFVRALPVLTALAALSACSLVLQDPTPFVVSHPDAAPDAAPQERLADSFVQPDFSPPDAAPPIAHHDATLRRDAAFVPDAAPDPDAAPVVDALPPDACVPATEVCNGRDDDCDGQVDESDPRLCQRCGPPRAQGLCAVGGFICQHGALVCAAWLPDAGPALDCDDLDDDCDGTTDEAGEVVRARTADEQAVVDRCGARADAVPAPPEGDCSADPRVVGCTAVHACVDAGCRRNCFDDEAELDRACDADCAGRPDAAARAECLEACRAPVRQSLAACIATCGQDFPTGATRWTCAGAAGGPACVARDCPDGTHADGPRCVAD
jgi:hypothetical protein